MQSYLINALLAAVVAIVVSLIMGPIVIPFLKKLKVGQNIREDGPRAHFAKAGTPTMGGIIIITAVMMASFIMAGSSTEALAALLLMIAFAAIGFWDDYIKVVLKRSLGLRAREKFGLQLLTAFLFGLLLILYFKRGTAILMPFSGQAIDLGWLYLPFIIIVVVGTANAVNLTDGLDGLASGVSFFASLALGAVCLITGHYGLLIFCGALAGACLGFLVFNRHPARVFMGDTGSMALGGAAAAVAAFTRAEIALVIIGGVYVIETLSVILQVISYQTTRRRIFLMAPLHHHYELKGWPEAKVVRFFWALSFIFMLLGIWSFWGFS